MLQLTLDLVDQAQTENLPGAYSSFGSFISGILGGVMALAAILVLLYLVWGAVEWITAGGDNSKIQKARDKITQSVIGIIVLASSWALFMLVQNFLGISVLTPRTDSARRTPASQQNSTSNEALQDQLNNTGPRQRFIPPTP